MDPKTPSEPKPSETPSAESRRQDYPWERPLPVKKDNGHRLPVVFEINPDYPGSKAPCPRCGRMVATTRVHSTRKYGSANQQPADEWDTVIIYHCSEKETIDQGLTIFHEGQRRVLSDEETAKTYRRHEVPP